ncbi:MAG: hypothetical protein IJ748_06550 [Bacteroidales bacterium]|nr:hypothetical protein [Bacteroidales bacterium]
MKPLFLLAAFFSFFSLSGQQDFQSREKDLSFGIDVSALFNNHEFKRDVAYGYTLGGMRLLPYLSYAFTNEINLSLGVNALRYWGTNDYPYAFYLSVPEYGEDKQRGMHVLPYMRLSWQINDKTSLVIGNLDNSSCHGLDLALWNPELTFSQDYEEGLQLRYESKYFSNEVWLSWQNFNFRNDVDRESFLLGISGDVNTDYSKRHSFFLDYSFMWQHHGGELDTLTSLPLDHWINGNFGLNYMLLFGKRNLYGLLFSLDWLYCKSLRNDTWFFKAGNGLFFKLSAFGVKYNARIGFYYSEDMISFYGSPFFSNLAQRNPQEYYPQNKLLYSHFDYSIYRRESTDILLSADVYYKLDSKTNLTQENRNISFSLGLSARLKTEKKIMKF